MQSSEFIFLSKVCLSLPFFRPPKYKDSKRLFSHRSSERTPQLLSSLPSASEMDPYKHISGAEGCSSSESGWTMYLASPMQEDEDDEGSYDGGNNSEAHMARYKNQYAAVEDEVSDDSMASDASSGPHHQNSHENGHGTVNFKHNKGGHFNLQSSSAKKPGKKDKKSDKNSAVKSRKLDSHRKHK